MASLLFGVTILLGNQMNLFSKENEVVEDVDVSSSEMIELDEEHGLSSELTDKRLEAAKYLKQHDPESKTSGDLIEKRTLETNAEQELDDILLLVNKERGLPTEYVPADLVEPDVPFPFEEELPQRLMRKEAAKALEDLFEKALKDDLNLYAQSGYRSYQRQEAIFAFNAEKSGEEKANQVSARAGHSEHQTGLAMDVTSPDVHLQLSVAFENTKEGEWIKVHAPTFGFIIRYPQGKEEITGYQYEPWHLRYVGKEAALKISQQGITLEQYLGFK